MDQEKTGALIRRLRTKKGLTQKALAERLHVSDKAVSKWERGRGYPDVSLLSALAEALGADARVLLSGELQKNESEKGNMKKTRFYICRECGNIITATSEADVTCCGNRLTAMEPRKAADGEALRVEKTDGALFVTADHPMTKAHYISFAAYLNDQSVLLSKQYPEWDLQVTLPLRRAGRLVWYCTQCGLLYTDFRLPKSQG